MMGSIKHFTDLEVWQRSHKLFLALVEDVDTFPRRRTAAILTVDSSQLPVDSQPTTVNRYSVNCQRSTVNCELGEANETENWLYKIRDAGFLQTETANLRLEETRIIARMLISLMHSIEKRPDRKTR